MKGANRPQTLTGIETLESLTSLPSRESANRPQTLTGIETAYPPGLESPGAGPAPIDLKPLQGLKQYEVGTFETLPTRQSTSNPYRD